MEASVCHPRMLVHLHGPASNSVFGHTRQSFKLPASVSPSTGERHIAVDQCLDSSATCAGFVQESQLDSLALEAVNGRVVGLFSSSLGHHFDYQSSSIFMQIVEELSRITTSSQDIAVSFCYLLATDTKCFDLLAQKNVDVPAHVPTNFHGLFSKTDNSLAAVKEVLAQGCSSPFVLGIRLECKQSVYRTYGSLYLVELGYPLFKGDLSMASQAPNALFKTIKVMTKIGSMLSGTGNLPYEESALTTITSELLGGSGKATFLFHIDATEASPNVATMADFIEIWKKVKIRQRVSFRDPRVRYLEELSSTREEQSWQLHQKISAQLAQTMEVESQLSERNEFIEKLEHQLQHCEMQVQSSQTLAESLRSELQQKESAWRAKFQDYRSKRSSELKELSVKAETTEWGWKQDVAILEACLKDRNTRRRLDADDNRRLILEANVWISNSQRKTEEWKLLYANLHNLFNLKSDELIESQSQLDEYRAEITRLETSLSNSEVRWLDRCTTLEGQIQHIRHEHARDIHNHQQSFRKTLGDTKEALGRQWAEKMDRLAAEEEQKRQALQDEIELLDQASRDQNMAHKIQTEDAQARHQQEISQLHDEKRKCKSDMEAELHKMITEHQAELVKTHSQHQADLESAHNEHEQHIQQLEQSHMNVSQRLQALVDQQNEKLKDLERQQARSRGEAADLRQQVQQLNQANEEKRIIITDLEVQISTFKKESQVWVQKLIESEALRLEEKTKRFESERQLKECQIELEVARVQRSSDSSVSTQSLENLKSMHDIERKAMNDQIRNLEHGSRQALKLREDAFSMERQRLQTRIDQLEKANQELLLENTQRTESVDARAARPKATKRTQPKTQPLESIREDSESASPSVSASESNGRSGSGSGSRTGPAAGSKSSLSKKRSAAHLDSDRTSVVTAAVPESTLTSVAASVLNKKNIALMKKRSNQPLEPSSGTTSTVEKAVDGGRKPGSSIFPIVDSDQDDPDAPSPLRDRLNVETARSGTEKPKRSGAKQSAKDLLAARAALNTSSDDTSARLGGASQSNGSAADHRPRRRAAPTAQMLHVDDDDDDSYSTSDMVEYHVRNRKSMAVSASTLSTTHDSGIAEPEPEPEPSSDVAVNPLTSKEADAAQKRSPADGDFTFRAPAPAPSVQTKKKRRLNPRKSIDKPAADSDAGSAPEQASAPSGSSATASSSSAARERSGASAATFKTMMSSIWKSQSSARRANLILAGASSAAQSSANV
ncbi:uncharacterized protein BJ171DRAFT_519215 [Polychytrium aggregatum]|uniref:uncharacterized protein n=1 Tax=Polychytrium aggregatum TaxID=110093 RepID=UPI0022FE924C|nr:uncharacterized protein BJ171DRAFT_519215 [Polychytrium aggregatum]KAI9199217.1 hypothetical protein BJ171DRAFT_519215 [Polychytrium aggregatum]